MRLGVTHLRCPKLSAESRRPSLCNRGQPAAAYISTRAHGGPTPCGQAKALPAQAAVESLLVCGGGSAVPGLAARLVRELHARLLSTTAPKLLQLPEYMPPHTLACASWMGGAVLAKVGTGPADKQGNACQSKRDVRSFTLHMIGRYHFSTKIPVQAQLCRPNSGWTLRARVLIATSVTRFAC